MIRTPDFPRNFMGKKYTLYSKFYGIYYRFRVIDTFSSK